MKGVAGEAAEAPGAKEGTAYDRVPKGGVRSGMRMVNEGSGRVIWRRATRASARSLPLAPAPLVPSLPVDRCSPSFGSEYGLQPLPSTRCSSSPSQPAALARSFARLSPSSVVVAPLYSLPPANMVAGPSRSRMPPADLPDMALLAHQARQLYPRQVATGDEGEWPLSLLLHCIRRRRDGSGLLGVSEGHAPA